MSGVGADVRAPLPAALALVVGAARGLDPDGRAGGLVRGRIVPALRGRAYPGLGGQQHEAQLVAEALEGVA